MKLAALFAAGIVLLAGSAMGAQVTGDGRQTVKAMPDAMEMTLFLQASDKQFDKALATVQQQDADLEKALHALQNARAEVKTQGPWLGVAPADREAMSLTESYMPPRPAEATEGSDEGKVTVSMVVAAKWKLAGRDGLAITKEVQAIEDAVNAALPKSAAVPEVAQTEEQVQQMLDAASRANEPPSLAGKPTFAFTATLPADKAAEAKAQVYKKARADAESLAQAAGMKLGALQELTGEVDVAGMSERYYGSSETLASLLLSRESDMLGRSPQARELTFEVSVEALFDLVPGQ